MKRRSVVLWTLVALATVGFGGISRAAGLDILGAAAYVGVGLAYIVTRRERRAVAAVQVSMILLSVALSAVAPTQINAAGPLFVAGFCAIALLLERRPLRGVLTTGLVLVMAATVVVSSVLHESTVMTAKAVGIGAMWTLVVLVSSSVGRNDARSVMFPTVLGVGVASSVIALLEGPLGVSAIRQYVAADISGEYVPNFTPMYGFLVVRAQATFGYPIILGAVLALCLVIVLVSTHMRTSLRVGLGALFTIGILVTGARSAIVAVVAGVLVFTGTTVIRAVRDKRSTRTIWSKPEFLVAVGICLLGVSAAVVFLIRSLASSDLSLFHRGGMIAAVTNLPGERPWVENIFGSGYGSVERAFADGLFGTDYEVVALDNTFAWMFVVGGVLGLGLLIAILVIAFVRGGDVLRPLLAVLVAEFFFFDIFTWHVVGFLLFVLVGLSSAVWSTERVTVADGGDIAQHRRNK